MLLVLGKSAIEMPARRGDWAWEGVSSLGALEAVGVVEGLQDGALHHLVHGLAFSGVKGMVCIQYGLLECRGSIAVGIGFMVFIRYCIFCTVRCLLPSAYFIKHSLRFS